MSHVRTLSLLLAAVALAACSAPTGPSPAASPDDGNVTFDAAPSDTTARGGWNDSHG